MPDPSPTGVLGLREGDVVRIVIDRPRALNALSLSMVHGIHELLETWRSKSVRAVTIESSTPGIFCAGGDIRQIRQNSLDDDFGASDDFFATEYRVNELIASYPVPVVALVDGVCFGGGLGLSVHGSFRVVTERAVLAMPETAIGFFPDIGASHFLSRLPGGVGTYLGLTGARIGPADALNIGLATHHVASEALASIPALLDRDRRPVDAVLRDLSSAPAGESSIAVNRGRIDNAFSGTSIDSIVRHLTEDGSEWSLGTLDMVRRMSPQSLELTLDLILWGRQRTLRECLDADRDAVAHAIGSPDFIEGVRATLVDKDHTPGWGESEYAGMSAGGEILWAR